MTNEKSKNKDVSERSTNSDNPVEDAPILKKHDSDIKLWHEKRQQAKSFKLTGHDAHGKPQKSFAIHMTDGTEVKDNRPLRVNGIKEQDEHLQSKGVEQLSEHQLQQVVSPHLDNPEGEKFRNKVQEGLNSIPQSVQTYLQQGNWKVRLDESIAKDDPALAARTANNHAEAGGNFAGVFGGSDTNQNAIVVAQKAAPLNKTDHNWESERINPHPEQTVRHEAGHAVDNALHWYSQSPEFSKAYDECCKHVPDDVRAKLSYYLKDPASGKQELFAELFAAEHGGGPDQQTGLDPLLLKYFGPCLQLIKQEEALIQQAYGHRK